MYRYYSTERPVMPGTFPRQDGTEDIYNFFYGKIFCEEIQKEAWGYIEYQQPISPEKAQEYELTESNSVGKVLEGTDENGKIVAFIVEAECGKSQ